MDSIQILNSFYGEREEDKRLMSRHGAVEFTLTTAYIGKYLKKGSRILEIGCGTGRYSLYYAHQGYEVDAMDLVESNLEVMRRNILETDRVRAVQGNALDLSRYPDSTFDITLLLGPMYHLYTQEDKLQCLREAVRVTKPKGILFVAYCQFDASMIQAAFGKKLYDFVADNGFLDTERFLPVSNPAAVFELHRKEQIDALDARLPVKRLHYIGTDMFTEYCPDMIEQLDDRLYQKYIEYTLTVCENQNLVGASNHTLDILQKLPYPDWKGEPDQL